MIVDASEGLCRVRPEPFVAEQFQSGPALIGGEELPPARTADGQTLEITASCGNLADVELATEVGVADVGLYRTELLYLVDRESPSVEALTAHYGSVLERAGEGKVVFRLLDLDSSMGVGPVHKTREPNPQLGLVGVRGLLSREPLLRGQLSALLRAGAGAEGRVEIVVPKVIDCSELRRVKELVFEERHALRQIGVDASPDIPVGVVIETPAAAIGARELARESDRITIGLDSLQQYLLATDRDNPELGHVFERLHPLVVRVLSSIVSACEEARVSLTVFGVSAALPAYSRSHEPGPAGLQTLSPRPVQLRLRRCVVIPLTFSAVWGKA